MNECITKWRFYSLLLFTIEQQIVFDVFYEHLSYNYEWDGNNLKQRKLNIKIIKIKLKRGLLKINLIIFIFILKLISKVRIKIYLILKVMILQRNLIK